MPLRYAGARSLGTGNNTVLQGAAAASVSFWLKLHAGTGAASAGHALLFAGQSFRPFAAYISQGQSRTLNFRWEAATRGEPWYVLPSDQDATYHVASTFDGEAVRLYVNGDLVATQPASGVLQSPGARPLVLNGNATMDYSLDDPAIWQGYVLTEQDIRALRDRTAAPEDIAPGDIAWHLTLDGEPGAAATVGDPGLDAFGFSNADITTIPDPAPVYEAGDLIYEKARVRWAGIGASGKTLALLVENAAGKLDNPTAITAHPTISVNGGEPIQLADPIWGEESSTRAPYVVYPLSTPIDPTDSVTISAPEDWANIATGIVAGLDSVPVANGPDRSYLPPFVVEPKSMPVGYNLPLPIYYVPVPIYANAVKHAGGFWGGSGVTWVEDADGYPISITGDSDVYCQTLSSNEIHHGGSSGEWTLRWDGAVQPRVRAAGGTAVALLESSGDPQATGNWHVYQVDRITADGITLNLAIPAGTRNIRLYPPGVPTDGSQKFHPELLKRLAGTRCIRFMGAVKTNQSNVTSAAHFKTQSARSCGASSRIQSTLTGVGPADNDDGHYGWLAQGGWVPFRFTTAAPHGFTTGQIVAFSGMSGPIALADGRTFNANNYDGVVHVLSPTEFAVALYVGGTVTTTVVPGQAITGDVSVSIMPGMPPEDIAELCNLVGCDAWVNVPHALDDEGVTAMAQTLATTLDPGRKCRVEYSNEPWNTANAFKQSHYFIQMGGLEGITAQQWYAKRAGQVHALFAAAFAAAGRPQDIIRFFNIQISNPGGTTRQIVDYCAANGIPIDEIGGAPYITNRSGREEFDIEQWMDLTELDMVHGWHTGSILPHSAILHEKFPDAKFTCYEGGPEYGGRGIADPEAARTRSWEWSRHPRMRGILLRFLQQLQDQGCALFAYFLLTARYGRLHVTDSQRGDAVWSAYTYWNQPAGLGDGTDGKLDNRTDLLAHNQVVSVIGGAIDTWEALVPGPTTPGSKPSSPRPLPPRPRGRRSSQPRGLFRPTGIPGRPSGRSGGLRRPRG